MSWLGERGRASGEAGTVRGDSGVVCGEPLAGDAEVEPGVEEAGEVRGEAKLSVGFSRALWRKCLSCAERMLSLCMTAREEWRVGVEPFSATCRLPLRDHMGNGRDAAPDGEREYAAQRHGRARHRGAVVNQRRKAVSAWRGLVTNGAGRAAAGGALCCVGELGAGGATLGALRPH